MHKWILAVSLCAVSGAAHTWGVETLSFSQLDLNRDGVISREEAAFSNRLLRSFESADLNRDGFIDRAEFAREIASEAIRPTRA